MCRQSKARRRKMATLPNDFDEPEELLETDDEAKLAEGEKRRGGSSKQKSFRRLRQLARSDDEKNLDIYRMVRDDPEATPAERMRAAEKLNEIAYDKPGARPVATDTGMRPKILIEMPHEQLESYRTILVEENA